MKLGFYLMPSGEDIDFVWVSVNKLEQFWKLNDDYIDSWKGRPKEKWFMQNINSHCLYAGEICIDTIGEDRVVMFLHGGHRTRWLIQQEVDEVPVGMPSSETQLGKEIGLVIRDVEPDDGHLEIPFKVFRQD